MKDIQNSYLEFVGFLKLIDCILNPNFSLNRLKVFVKEICYKSLNRYSSQILAKSSFYILFELFLFACVVMQDLFPIYCRMSRFSPVRHLRRMTKACNFSEPSSNPEQIVPFKYSCNSSNELIPLLLAINVF